MPLAASLPDVNLFYFLVLVLLSFDNIGIEGTFPKWHIKRIPKTKKKPSVIVEVKMRSLIRFPNNLLLSTLVTEKSIRINS